VFFCTAGAATAADKIMTGTTEQATASAVLATISNVPGVILVAQLAAEPAAAAFPSMAKSA
jgi:hypothetical protein